MKPAPFTYQEFARQKILSRQKTAVIAPPGSGKTRPIIEALRDAEILGKEPILIICSGPAVATWRWQLPYWGDVEPHEVRIIRGKPSYRAAMWSHTAETAGIAITNHQVLQRDWIHVQSVEWGAVVADEYHKFMRGRKGKTYRLFRQLERRIDYLVLTTGSLINDDPSSMFTGFQLLDPKAFSSYWRFVGTFCLTQETPFGKEIIGVRNVQALRDITDRYMAYIPEDVVADQLPKGFRYSIDVDMTESQSRVYEDLTGEMIATVEDDLVMAANPLSLLIRLRQLLCCPKILNEKLDMGGGYEWILDQFDEPKENHPYCVIFVPFRPACEYIVDDLRERGYHARFLRGGMSEDEQDEIKDDFRARAGTGAILVCTISFSESFDLEKCQQSYFLGYDYDVEQNRQAEGRTRRAISEHGFVRWGYIRYTGTVDDTIFQDMDNKFRTIKRVLQRPEAFIQALRGKNPEA